MPETQHVAEAVNTLISMIRSYGALSECDTTLPKNARTNALLRRLMRGVDAIRAPALPFIPPPSLRFVGSIGELRQIGRKFKNCLSSMDHYAMRLWFGLADGSVIFLVHDVPFLLIALRQVGRNVWQIEEVNGPKGGSPTMAGKAVEAALREAGVNLVTMDPLQAIWKLQEIAKGRPTGHEKFIDEFDGIGRFGGIGGRAGLRARVGQSNEYLDRRQGDDTGCDQAKECAASVGATPVAG